MADYYIYAVHQVDDVIQEVKTCTGYNTFTGPTDETKKTRSTVISDIDTLSKSIWTVYKDKNDSNKWKLGAKVVTEEIEKKKYIKTKANGKKADNLENIEQY